ncbi:hypothetical protein [Acinetobacter sp. Marseille-Q1618]|uniref:secretion/conjugation apparatus DotM-related subunit n=1 Tax=Acinetobacter sp. Marseille-Q1618 TaxID=2697502 RepID=UPI0020C22CDF|nr:hypothetical protein [Acinetobacter sp. Marseille-Q1618]
MEQNNINRGDSSADTLVVIVMLVGFVCAFFWGTWKIGHEFIIKSTRIIFGIIELPFWYIQIAIQKLTNSKAEFLNFTTNTIGKLCYPDHNHLYNPLLHCTVNTKTITFEFYYLNNLFPSILIGAAMVGYVWYKHTLNLKDIPDVRYAKQHDLESLIKELGGIYPHLKYITHFVQSKTSTDKGFYRFMLSPREFIAENELASGFRKYEIETIADFNQTDQLTNSQKDNFYPVLKEVQFKKIMMQQLGQLIYQPSNLTDGEINLFAIFLPVACATDENMSDQEFKNILKQKDQLLDYFWKVALNQLKNDKGFINEKLLTPREYKGFNRKKIESYVNKYWNHPVSQKIFSQHAYASSALIAIIYKARTLGVLAPCEMRWLRMYDRTLWALVQNVGRPSIFAEQIAAFSHYTSECYYSRKKVSPDFSYAWLGLNESLKRYKYTNPDIYIKEINKNTD